MKKYIDNHPAFWPTAFALAWLLAMAIVIYLGRQSSHPDYPVLKGDCFIFSEGWEPITVKDGTSRYVCRHIESGQYRQCIPQYVACEGE